MTTLGSTTSLLQNTAKDILHTVLWIHCGIHCTGILISLQQLRDGVEKLRRVGDLDRVLPAPGHLVARADLAAEQHVRVAGVPVPAAPAGRDLEVVRHAFEAGVTGQLLGLLDQRRRPVLHAPERDALLLLLGRETGAVQAVDLLRHDEQLGREGDVVPDGGEAVRPQIRLHLGDILRPLLLPRLLRYFEGAARPVQPELRRDGVVVREEVRGALEGQAARQRALVVAGEVREELHALLGDALLVDVEVAVVGGVFLFGRHGGFGEGDVLFQGVAVAGGDVAAVVLDGFEDLVPVADGVVYHLRLARCCHCVANSNLWG
ncbi:hypothetical protein PG991_013075 [Apiospora marii]|uniref:Uncharacterized protein n=1 Tax=Apiospora marii TaxID=335849 RepID=A0ABR1R563_9PEZI